MSVNSLGPSTPKTRDIEDLVEDLKLDPKTPQVVINFIKRNLDVVDGIEVQKIPTDLYKSVLSKMKK